MKAVNFLKKNLFVIMSVILILCVIDQIYMLIRYKNISIETLFLTLCIAALNIYFARS